MTGELFKRYRHEAGLTVLQLSSLAGLSDVSIYEIENDKRSPRLNSVERLLKAMKLKLTVCQEQEAEKANG